MRECRCAEDGDGYWDGDASVEGGVEDAGGGGKKVGESSAMRVAAKSGGVTSETNHGMSFGLRRGARMSR